MADEQNGSPPPTEADPSPVDGAAPPVADAASPSSTPPPAPRRSDLLRDFRQQLAKPNHRAAGRGRRPTGGNPRFR